MNTSNYGSVLVTIYDRNYTKINTSIQFSIHKFADISAIVTDDRWQKTAVANVALTFCCLVDKIFFM